MIDRRLHVLRMVEQHGTVTAAAAALHLTPSAVSQQVRSLSRDLDVVLFQPAGRGIRLTPAARILLGHADRLAADREAALADLAAHRSGDLGPVRLCGFPSALAALLPATAAALADRDPPVDLVVAQADPGESLDRLLDGDADLAILEAGPAVPDTVDHRFEAEQLFVEPLQVVVPVSHRLAAAGTVALHDLVDEAWVAGPDGGDYHAIEVAACQRAGFTPHVVHRALDWSAYLAVVEAGLGIALLPRLAVPPTAQSIRTLDLTNQPQPSRRVLTCIRRGSTDHPLIRATRDALAEAAEVHLG